MHDVGRRRDQHAPDGDALDVHAQDLAGDAGCLVRTGGELDATGLAAAAHQHLRLDHDLVGAAGQEVRRRFPRRHRRVDNRVVGDGQALLAQQCLGVVLLQLQGARLLRVADPGSGRRLYAAPALGPSPLHLPP